MNLLPALWKRSRPGLFRAVAVMSAVATVAYSAVAVTATPAQAQTVSSLTAAPARRRRPTGQ